MNSKLLQLEIGFILLFLGWLFSQSVLAASVNQEGEIPLPVNEPIYVVVKGAFPSKQEAEKTRAFIQQLLVKTKADGIVESEKLAGFPARQWLVVSAFDSEAKAKWWMSFGDRNPKLPKAYIRQSRLLVATDDIPYFPDPIREGEKRFFTEEEVLARIHQFPDVMSLKQKNPIKFVFLAFPRTGYYVYEVEIMKSEQGKFIAYDFVSMFAGNLNKYKRSLENMK